MRIPSDPVLREGFYYELIQSCLTSRTDRKQEYDRLRNYFLFGCAPDNDPATHNKINPTIDTLKSFLFAADTVRFSIKLGTSANMDIELPRVPPLVARLMDRWEDSNADIVFGNSVTWSLVKNTAIIKLVQRGRDTHPFLVDPENFGVLNEGTPMMDRQEAFVEVYMTTKSQLERDLAGHPRLQEILMRVSASKGAESQLPAGVQRVITSSFYPTAQGNAPAPLSISDMYRPRTSEELIEMYELWLWDDDIAMEGPSGKKGGWRCVTQADPSITIFDRAAYNPQSKDGRQLFLKGEHPYTQVCPNPAPDYFWGYSEVERLTRLQDMREKAVLQVNDLLDRNVTPPKALTGMWGAVDEKDLALQKMGALISSNDPTAKVNEFKPQIPQDIWAFIREIDAQFQEQSSLNNVMMGRGEAGVRSKGQTDKLAQLGASRPKQRALIIEDALERIATLYLKLDQAHNKGELKSQPVKPGEKQVEFTASQFTTDFMVKVDAHSSSPVFMEEQRNLAFELFDRKIVDGDHVLDVVHPQNTQTLKVKYRIMQEALAKQAQAEQQAQAAGGGKPKLAAAG